MAGERLRSRSTLDRLSVAALLSGNVLEWYDFYVYAAVAPIIAKEFFPKQDQSLALVLTFAVFAISFLMRPLGGLLVGLLGDRLGRRRALLVSVSLMAFPTVAVAILPTYADEGEVASLLLLLLRAVQGLAVGGEFPSTISYLVESAPPNRRGLFGSLAELGPAIGILLATGITTLVDAFASADQMAEWGWRIPFLCAFALVVVIFVLRLGLGESPMYAAMGKPRANPIVSALKTRRAEMAKVFFYVFLNAIAGYTVVGYSTTYLSTVAGFSYGQALAAALIGTVGTICAVPAFGLLSDRIGRRQVSGIAAGLMLLLAYPIFLGFNQGSFPLAIACQLLVACLLGMNMGPIPTLIAEQFGTGERISAVSMPYNAALAIFGGTAPLVAEFLATHTGSKEAPAFYIMMAAVVTLTTVFTFRETAFEKLR